MSTRAQESTRTQETCVRFATKLQTPSITWVDRVDSEQVDCCGSDAYLSVRYDSTQRRSSRVKSEA